MSVPPPGGNATMMRTGFAGKGCCAKAKPGIAHASADHAAAAAIRFFMRDLLLDLRRASSGAGARPHSRQQSVEIGVCVSRRRRRALVIRLEPRFRGRGGIAEALHAE